MIPLLYQLSYTGTKSDHSVKIPRCPVRPSSSSPVVVRNPSGVLISLKNLLIPKSCGLCANRPQSDFVRFSPPLIPLCESCSKDLSLIQQLCRRCLHLPGPPGPKCQICRHHPHERPLISLGLHEGSLRRWVLWAKHGQREDLTMALAQGISELWKQYLQLKQTLEGHTESSETPCESERSGQPIITAIPRSPLRVLIKGQPMTRLLATQIAQELGFSDRSLLCQNGFGAQSRKTGALRRSMPRDRFQLRNHEKKRLKKYPMETPAPGIVLVDDVLTTGTTLRVCTQALEAAGYRVLAWLVATVTPNSRQ
ncbi:hypothetical protein CBD41_02810 [bacterium TMED181]|nr:hypothetical protein [Planctomycetota bacterium]OUW46214.1 MAG: hypothetical protein CBD41_02810 [bacterium TMED181]